MSGSIAAAGWMMVLAAAGVAGAASAADDPAPINARDLVVASAFSGGSSVRVFDAVTGDLDVHIPLEAFPEMQAPSGVAFGPEGDLYVWIQDNGPIHVYHGTTGHRTAVIAEDGAGGFFEGRDIVFAPDGALLVAGGASHRVARFDGRTGQYMDDFVRAGAGGLANALGLAFGPDGSLFVTSADTDQVLEYDGRTGAFVGVFVPAGAGGLSVPYDVTFAPGGSMLVSARDLGRVFAFDGETGAALGVLTQTPVAPLRGVTVGPNGNLYACSWGGPQGGGVYEFDMMTGRLVRRFAASVGASFLTFKPVADQAADVNDDGLVDMRDLLTILGNWGPCPAEPRACSADVDRNGEVDEADLLAALARWG